MCYVFCIDKNKKPLDLLHPKTAKELMKNNKASVFKPYPFVLILNQESVTVNTYKLKIDPGSKTTGLSLVEDKSGNVVWAAQLEHHRAAIVSSLKSRSAIRRNRRSRNTPYRKKRFLNRTRKSGWLPPSAESCLYNIVTWVKRFVKYCPISEVWIEQTKFDTQKALNPNIKGKEYQEGPLKGFKNPRVMLLATQDRCNYCKKTVEELKKLGIGFERDHYTSRRHGGSDSSRNAVLSCHICNQNKGKKDGGEKKIANLTGMSAMNQIRYILPNRIAELGLVVRCFDGATTAKNREKFVCSKEVKDKNKEDFHWVDASCIGEIGNVLCKINSIWKIKAKGHGTRQMCQTDKYGFPKRHRKKKTHNIKTGDIVKDKETNEVSYVAGARANGQLGLKKGDTNISRTCKKVEVIHHSDGFDYKNVKIHKFASGFFANPVVSEK